METLDGQVSGAAHLLLDPLQGSGEEIPIEGRHSAYVQKQTIF